MDRRLDVTIRLIFKLTGYFPTASRGALLSPTGRQLKALLVAKFEVLNVSLAGPGSSKSLILLAQIFAARVGSDGRSHFPEFFNTIDRSSASGRLARIGTSTDWGAPVSQSV